MPYTPILATLGYILSPDGRQVLLIHRNRRPGDPHLGKFNGLGGKLDPGEDILTGMRREIREESGLECDEILLAGTINWPGFGKGGEDWFGFIFRIERLHRHAVSRQSGRESGMGRRRACPRTASVGGGSLFPAFGLRAAVAAVSRGHALPRWPAPELELQPPLISYLF